MMINFCSFHFCVTDARFRSSHLLAIEVVEGSSSGNKVHHPYIDHMGKNNCWNYEPTQLTMD
jgi:hypothetical protein